MKLEVGSEKRFFEFMQKLNDKDKIALISHTDLDGLAAAKVANFVIDADIVKLLGYTDLNLGLVEELREGGVNKIIFTDLYIKDAEFLKELEKFAEILILDHHLFMQDWNSERTVFVKCEGGFSAGYLCYELFGKIQSLEKLDWVVACCCVSDYCHVKPREWLSGIYEKYGDVLEITEDGYVRKSGKIWDLQYKISLGMIYFRDELEKTLKFVGEEFGDIGEMAKHADEVDDEIKKTMLEFDEKKEEFDDGYFFEINPVFPITSILSNIVSGKYQDKFIVLTRLDLKSGGYHVSVRRQDKKKSADEFLRQLLKGIDGASGGGHVPAAGGQFPRLEMNEIRRRLGLDEKSVSVVD